ncbi:MAG TPA: hypothetical protein VGE74_15735, partial [Gemmata sp.]
TDPDVSSPWGRVLRSHELIVFVAIVTACSVYANMAHDITAPREFRYFPPFRSGYNRNMVDHLGAEYLSIAQAICSGRGFADPFDRETGPTAWMPPILPFLLAALWSVTDGDRDTVTNVLVVLHCAALVWTVAFALRVWWGDRPRAGAALLVCVLLLEIMANFRYAFQLTHDHFLVLAGLNGLALWAGCGRPLASRPRSFGWGLFGGVAALITPAMGLVWAALTVTWAWRERSVARAALAGVGAALALTPWAVRNYVTFGKVIPVKSNANFELYQSHCMQPDGLLQTSSFAEHPRRAGSEQALEYDELGEAAFLARKGEQFRTALRADPGEFVYRAGDRFMAAVLWYTPRNRSGKGESEMGVWLARALHPLPWVALIVIVMTARWRPPSSGELATALAIVAYITPYIIISYNERYEYPLMGLKSLLILYGFDRAVGYLSGAPSPGSTGRAS